MDWAKIFFCLYLALSNGVSLKTDSSRKVNISKEEKTNNAVSNSTKNSEETLEGLPSETIKFQNPIIFQESAKDVPAGKDFGGVETAKNKNNQERNAKDLNQEANGYIPVLSFPESPIPNVRQQWQAVPEVTHYREQNEFRSPLPIIESQSFINKPGMSSTQIIYSPPGNSEDVHFHPRHAGYPAEYRNPDDQRYTEPVNNPGRGHTVHTETTHDYGRFLPSNYKSKIEQEAEALVKKQKAQNSSTAERPEQAKRPQQGERNNRQRAPSYFTSYRPPVNTAFFHKGGFDDAYEFPEKGEDHGQRNFYTTEKYIKPQYTYDQREPVTSSVEGISNGPRQPVTSTETYKQHYPYPAERQTRPPHEGPPNAPRQYDSSTEKYSPTYADAFEKPLPSYPEAPHSQTQYGPSAEAPYSPTQYGTSSEQQVPQHHNEDKRILTSYSGDFNQPQQHAEPTPKEHHQPYFNNPSIESPVSSRHPPHYIGHSASDIPNSNEPYAKPVDDVAEEKAYYNTFKSLIDLYKSLGFQPFNLEEIPTIQPPRFAFGNPIIGKLVVSSPVSASAEDFYPNSNAQKYSGNTDSHSPMDQSYDHTRSPYSNTNYNKEIPRNPSYDHTRAPYSNTNYNKEIPRDQIYDHTPAPYSKTNYNKEVPRDQSHDHTRAPYSNTNYNTEVPRDQSYDHTRAHYSNTNYNKEVPRDQSYDHARAPYSTTNYKEVNGPGNSYLYFRPSSGRSKNSNYHEQVPFDSNRSPVVSTEHYETAENPRPDSQVVSPKETFVKDEFDTKTHSGSKSTPSDGIKVKGIRIKDYDSKNFFGNPSQKNLYNSAESDFSSSASMPDSPPHSHSVVRNNPYNVKDYHSEEERTTNRPRTYREKVIVKDLNPVVSSEERPKDFHYPNKRNKFRSSKASDSSRDASGDTSSSDSYPSNNEDDHKEYNLPVSKKSIKPSNKGPQGRTRSNRKSKSQKDSFKGEMSFHDQEGRSNRGRKTEPFQGDSSYNQPEQRSKSESPENQEFRSSKRSGKRSSQRIPQKTKPNSRRQRDHMRAEGSTYHWGMEKHKGTDGFFQYANVPGAKAYEFGYRMGGPEHTRERHHKTKGTQSKIKVNWEDENGDSGDHYWEFNHDSREDDTEESQPKKKKNKPE